MRDIVFTLHCAMRLMERGISPEQAAATVSFGKIVNRSEGKDMYALERLRVVMVRGSNVAVTAFREPQVSVKRNVRKARKERRKYRRRWG